MERKERNKKGGTYLQTTRKGVRDVILKQLPPGVVLASPAPHVLTLALLLALVQDAGSDAPDDDAEDEEDDGEGGVVDRHLLGSMVASSPVRPEDDDGHDERQAGDDQHCDLRPGDGVFGPRGQVVPRREVPGRVEDGEDGSQHRDDDQTAAEADASEEELCHSDFDFDFLFELLVDRLGHE